MNIISKKLWSPYPRSTPELSGKNSPQAAPLSFPLMNSCLIGLDFENNYLNVLPTLVLLNAQLNNLQDVSKTILLHSRKPNDGDDTENKGFG